MPFLPQGYGSSGGDVPILFSTVNVEEWEVTRDVNIAYQNTSGKPMLVVISLQCITRQQAAGTRIIGMAKANVQICPNSSFVYPDKVYMNEVGHKTEIMNQSEASNQSTAYHNICFIVPDGWYYKVLATVTGTGEFYKESWIEYV